MNLGDKIRILRERKGLTLQDIADVWGIRRSSVAGWEASTSRPDIDKLPGLARILGTGVDDLLSDRTPHEVAQELMPYGATDPRSEGKLPLISDVQAGNWSDIIDNFQAGDAEDWILCPFKHSSRAFILRVAGLSMYNPGGESSFAPGDFIAVDPQIEARNKKLVVARIDHEERATFKQLIIEPDGRYLLQALNPSWGPDRVMTMPPGSAIVGVVIGKWTAT